MPSYDSPYKEEEWCINAQRLGPPGQYQPQLTASCPHGRKHPQTKERVKVQYGYHLVADCRKANQGKKSHNDVEATIILHLHTYKSITAAHLQEHHGDQGQVLHGRHAGRHRTSDILLSACIPPSTTRRP